MPTTESAHPQERTPAMPAASSNRHHFPYYLPNNRDLAETGAAHSTSSHDATTTPRQTSARRQSRGRPGLVLPSGMRRRHGRYAIPRRPKAYYGNRLLAKPPAKNHRPTGLFSADGSSQLCPNFVILDDGLNKMLRRLISRREASNETRVNRGSDGPISLG